jgi:homospermidine synthase
MWYTKHMNITRHSQTFKELVARLQSGELTRAQAAVAYGVNPGTLAKWLLRSKVGESTRTKVDGKFLYGAAAEFADRLDPKIARLLEEATKKVLDGTFRSCLAAHRAYPDVVLGTLTARVRKARLAQGLPIGRQGKKPPPGEAK